MLLLFFNAPMRCRNMDMPEVDNDVLLRADIFHI